MAAFGSPNLLLLQSTTLLDPDHRWRVVERIADFVGAPRASLEGDARMRSTVLLHHKGSDAAANLSEAARQWVDCQPQLYACEVRLARELVYSDGVAVGAGFGWCADPPDIAKEAADATLPIGRLIPRK